MPQTAAEAARAVREICNIAPVIPVLTIRDASLAAPLAEALVAGGLPVLEVTLRTSEALAAIKIMGKISGAIVGAGTVINAGDADKAKAAGAEFAVSPGATDALLGACEAAALPILPGAATASEAMALLDRGYDMLKFFPAMAAGGPPALKALSAPLPQVSFCPTGGVSMENAPDFLSLPNVRCVGGSWIATDELVQNQAWDEIEARARLASLLGKTE